MTAAILPPAETTFFDDNGVPVALGFLYTYVPSTLTPKTTWLNAAKSQSNTNPIALDAAGRCICYGEGAYRTILKDADGNTIWDQVTSDGPVSSAMSPIVAASTIPEAEGLWEEGITSGSAPSGPVLGQRWIDDSDPDAVVYNIYDGAQWMVQATWDTVDHESITNGAMHLEASPVVETVPFAQSGQTIWVTGAIETTSIKSTPAEFAFSASMVNNTGIGASVTLSGNKVAGYFATQTNATGGNGWAVNGVLYIPSGGATLGGQQICEWDLVNNSGTNFGDGLGFTGIVQPAVFGHQTTAISTHRATAAHVILGNVGTADPAWNNGLVSGPFTIRQNFLADYSSAVRVFLVSGAHTFGIDFAGQTGEGANPATAATFSSAAIRLGNQHIISSRNAADSADLVILECNSSNQAVVARTAAGFRVANTTIFLQGMSGTASYANDAAAAAGGVAIDQVYRNGSVIQVRVT